MISRTSRLPFTICWNRYAHGEKQFVCGRDFFAHTNTDRLLSRIKKVLAIHLKYSVLLNLHAASTAGISEVDRTNDVNALRCGLAI